MSTPEEIVRKWYAESYNTISATARENSIFNRYLHRKLENGFNSNENLAILEVGGNKGEHTSYVKGPWNKYLMTDIKELTSEEINKLKNRQIEFAVEDVIVSHFSQ